MNDSPLLSALFGAAQPVEGASFISHLGYLPEAKILVVGFKSAPNSLNAYHAVPAETWETLREASSKGRAFHQLVRDHFQVTIHRQAQERA